VLHDAVLQHLFLGMFDEANYVNEFVSNYGEWMRGFAEELWSHRARSAADPRVLRLVAAAVAAAHDAGLSIEICGESASVPELAALFVGFGVDELSVAPARVDEIRATVRRLSATEAATVAAASLHADSADEALASARALLSGEGRDQQGELLGGRDGVVA